MPDKQTEHLLEAVEFLKDAIGHLMNGLPSTAKINYDAQTKFAKAFGKAGTKLADAKAAAEDPTRS